MSAPWQTLLRETRAAHASSAALRGFCDWPGDLAAQPVVPHHVPAADLMCADPGLKTGGFSGLRDELIACAPLAQWRETYRGTAIGSGFLDRFGCYEIMGRDAPFACAGMRGFVVYAPAGLHYPWHHHPAEELYLVIAGEAEFACAGAAPRTLRPGDTVFHAAGRPHAMTTHEHPVMALVFWRGDLDTAPVWSGPEAAA